MFCLAEFIERYLAPSIEVVNKTFDLLRLIVSLRSEESKEKIMKQLSDCCSSQLGTKNSDSNLRFFQAFRDDDENKLSTCCARPSSLKCRERIKQQISESYHDDYKS